MDQCVDTYRTYGGIQNRVWKWDVWVVYREPTENVTETRNWKGGH